MADSNRRQGKSHVSENQEFTITFKPFMLWHSFFARVKVNYRRVYCSILAKVCAVAMATALVKN